MRATLIGTLAAAAVCTAVLDAATANAAPPQPPAMDNTGIRLDILPGLLNYSSSVADDSVRISTPLGALTTRGTNQYQITGATGQFIAGTGFAAPPAAAVEPNQPSTPPMPAPPPIPGIGFHADQNTHTSEIDTPIGSVRVDGTTVTARDNSGHEASVGPPWIPADQPTRSDGALPGVRPVDDPTPPDVPPPPSPADRMNDFNNALGIAATEFGLATGVGAMVGGVIGLGAGCVLGGAVGLFATALMPPLVLPGVLGACIMGAVDFGGVGAIIGGAALGIPVGIVAGVQMYNSLHAKQEVAAVLPTD
ncbi:hypothetical protein [Nocardia arthritidis]|uniref:Uncharacterized protein n=1 Tax=Nocardia arthritidis TaxID=228602 RepID=A0A6G9YL93_9NOCA|nr:hypothetical protein [Nocardia arthritidis]QIS13982.1 hypothetical protein F5544_30695 [Nocardia arthritidis]